MDRVDALYLSVVLIIASASIAVASWGSGFAFSVGATQFLLAGGAFRYFALQEMHARNGVGYAQVALENNVGALEDMRFPPWTDLKELSGFIALGAPATSLLVRLSSSF